MNNAHLARLIADFRLTEARLTQSLRRNSSTPAHVSLMRHAAAQMDAIERLDPATITGRRTKAAFFMDRAHRRDDRRALFIALDIAASVCACPKTGISPSLSALPHEVVERLAARGVPLRDLTRHIAPLDQRVSLIDFEFRHVCTSAGNSRFHQRPSAAFEGLHIADLMGRERFGARIRRALRIANGGRAASYYQSEDVPAIGVRTMQYILRPWRTGTGAGTVAGVVLWTNDVTDRLTRSRVPGGLLRT